MNKFMWLDIETTGLDINQDYIMEVAMCVTDIDMNILDSINVVLSFPEFCDYRMNDYVTKMHTDSGLLDEARDSNVTVLEAEETLCRFFKLNFSKDDTVPMCGAGVHFDRAFLRNYMPELHDLFHYRNIDTSTLVAFFRKECNFRAEVINNNPHRAMYDTIMAIDIYKKHKKFIQTLAVRSVLP